MMKNFYYPSLLPYTNIKVLMLCLFYFFFLVFSTQDNNNHLLNQKLCLDKKKKLLNHKHLLVNSFSCWLFIKGGNFKALMRKLSFDDENSSCDRVKSFTSPPNSYHKSYKQFFIGKKRIQQAGIEEKLERRIILRTKF